jgi:hypothetical protein
MDFTGILFKLGPQPRLPRPPHVPRLVDVADPQVVEELQRMFRAAIPLDRALLCLDCDTLFEAEGNQRCPSCGSSHGWAAGRALNRDPQKEA